jgi:hypothetical protein
MAAFEHMAILIHHSRVSGWTSHATNCSDVSEVVGMGRRGWVATLAAMRVVAAFMGQ